MGCTVSIRLLVEKGRALFYDPRTGRLAFERELVYSVRPHALEALLAVGPDPTGKPDDWASTALVLIVSGVHSARDKLRMATMLVERYAGLFTRSNCCYRVTRRSRVLKTRQQTLDDGSIPTLCLPNNQSTYGHTACKTGYLCRSVRPQ